MSDADDEKWRTTGLEHIARAVEAGVEAFNIYESASVSRLDADGGVKFLAPAVWQRICELAG